MAHLWPQWHHRCITLKAPGSTVGMGGRHLCHGHWSSNHAAADKQQVLMLWALEPVSSCMCARADAHVTGPKEHWR